MQLLSLLTLSGLASSVVARSPKHVGKKIELPNRRSTSQAQTISHQKREENYIIPQNDKTAKYAVNGTAGAIPYVNFDIGESYAGLMPISSAPNETSELYFWFFPSSNVNASDEITVWLNGGPGCSSLEGFLQENGPINWQYGTYQPYYNPWNWANLTNMVWVEQPVGTGFSQGNASATSTEEVAQEFLGFFKNFLDTFELTNRKVYITGESYAGKYVPYFADAMLERNDTCYYDVRGILIYDPSVASDALLEDVPAVPYVDHWKDLFNLNASFTDSIHRRADECGYTEYIDKYLTFPPPAGPFPEPANNSRTEGCALWEDIFEAVLLTNPCFDEYQIATTCPLLWDVLGFPGSLFYIPDGAFVYFNLTDVQKAINAPLQEWEECSNGVLDTDTSPQSSYSVIPRIIEKLERTMIIHGELDYILLGNGTLLAIQNMTWGGLQGFQAPPTDEFFVPYHEELNLATLSASGVMGTTITERGLTFISQRMSGHMVPQYQPSSAYRQLEFLLGRVDSVTSRAPFSTRPEESSIANGTTSYKRDLGMMRARSFNDVQKWY